MIFNSNGSNFTFRTAFKFLYARGNKNDTKDLVQLLEKKYGGKATTYYRGRAALSAAVQASKAQQVIINAYTCYAVPQAVDSAGAEPVYADININTYNFGLNTLKAAHKSNPKTGAVIVQNTYGLSWDIRPVENYCKQNKLLLIEDLAHSVGMKYADGREAGTVGQFTMLSFGRDKHIDVVSGGALIVRGAGYEQLPQPAGKAPFVCRLKDRLYPIISWKIRILYRSGIGKIILKVSLKTGLISRSAAGRIMANSRLPDYKAKLVLNSFKYLEKNTTRRLKLVELMGVNLPKGSNPIRLPVVVKDRPKFYATSRKAGFSLYDTWYDSPIFPKRLQALTGYKNEGMVAQKVSNSVINVPLHINMSESSMADLKTVVEAYHV